MWGRIRPVNGEFGGGWTEVPVSVGGKFGQWELSQQDPREEVEARSVYWGKRVQSAIGKETAQVTQRPKTKENLNLKAEKRHQAQEWGGEAMGSL